MSKKKKESRDNFRNDVFKRDKYRCVMCELQSVRDPEIAKDVLDSHHIIDRNDMPNGG
jgi:hypothetical protein